MAKKKIKGNESFDKMSEALDTSFQGEEDIAEEVNTQLATVGDLKKDITTTDLTTYTLEDAKYMEQQIKKSLEGLEAVSNRLEQEIKIGSKASMFEVYATLANSKMNAIKELRELRKIILDLKIQLEKPKSSSPKNVTVNNYMSAKDVTKMLKDASANSKLKKIDATFKVDEE